MLNDLGGPFFLEDAIELTKHVVKSGAPWAARKGGGGKGRGKGGAEDDTSNDYDAMRRRYPQHAATTAQALASLDEDAINYELLVECVAALVTNGDAAPEIPAPRPVPGSWDADVGVAACFTPELQPRGDSK